MCGCDFVVKQDENDLQIWNTRDITTAITTSYNNNNNNVAAQRCLPAAAIAAVAAATALVRPSALHSHASGPAIVLPALRLGVVGHARAVTVIVIVIVTVTVTVTEGLRNDDEEGDDAEVFPRW